MKKILILALGFFSAALTKSSAALIIRNEGTGVAFCKWQLTATGDLAWNDGERDGMIASRNVFSSTGVTLTAGSFTNIAPSANQLAFSTTVYNGALQADGLTITGMQLDPFFLPFWEHATGLSFLDTTLGSNQPTFAYASFKDALDHQLTFKADMEYLAVCYAQYYAALDKVRLDFSISLPARLGRSRAIVEFIRRIYPGLQ